MKAREGARFVSLSSVKATAPGLTVNVIHPDGEAIWFINESDVSYFHE